MREVDRSNSILEGEGGGGAGIFNQTNMKKMGFVFLIP